MNLMQAFKMAFKSIASKKMRSFLTMLGIIIGVASVVIMVSVVQGQNKKQMEYLEAMGDNKIQVYAYQNYGSSGNVSELLYEYCLGMQDLVLGVTPQIEVWQEITIKYGAKTFNTQNWDDWDKRMSLKLGSDQYGVCNNYTLASGRELSFLDVDKTNRVCVLGGGAKKLLFDFVDPVGETIFINSQPFLVVGWYEPTGVEGMSDMDNMVLLPYTFNRTLNNNQDISQYVVKAKSASATTLAIAKLKAFLGGFINDENGYYDVYSNNDWSDQMQEQSLMQSLVLGAIAGISLLVGGIGIMNIMLVTVTERTREIGIRKAIGAERRSIIVQFLIEAAVICGIGGLIGIGLGCMGSLIAGKFLIQGMILWPSSMITIGAFTFSVVLGVVFGLYPAIKASSLQPVEALRAE
ncbi:MAG: ABC transporter permease [Oscillospiraceae bacterium]|nr:ABC transporter permease [Oscillospiraceae bacterium]MDE7004886.1 ABC transporter permease [Oscillospiraceae bacterium]